MNDLQLQNYKIYFKNLSENAIDPRNTSVDEHQGVMLFV
ncbi:hypothetical protein QE382_003488 [Sphingobacterium zeae]|uniref:Uncharacterized protein n=1 Tax=Sphingobacterium zeae TaxID=1776859 RepID=A0ABU0U9I8_9SPHI|nr:hypothetical protein [Sphingobacterium zeae]